MAPIRPSSGATRRGSQAARRRRVSSARAWNEAAATSLAFQVRPYFHQTWWFLALILGVALAAAPIAYVEQQRAQLQQLEQRHDSGTDVQSQRAAGIGRAKITNISVHRALFDRNEVHQIYREWREVFDEYDPPRVAVAEAYVRAERRVLYAKPDELGQAFNFDLLTSAWDAKAFKSVIDDNLDFAKQTGSSTTWVMSNHDVIRHATRLVIPSALGGVTFDAENHWGKALHDNEGYKQVWDGMNYAERVKMPVLWLSWPQDAHFPLGCQAEHCRPGQQSAGKSHHQSDDHRGQAGNQGNDQSQEKHRPSIAPRQIPSAGECTGKATFRVVAIVKVFCWVETRIQMSWIALFDKEIFRGLKIGE